MTAKAFEDHPELRDLGIEGTEIRRVRLVSPRGREIVVESSGDPFFTLYARSAFDGALRRRAVAAGARLASERVERVHHETDGVVVETERASERFDAVVGADGAFSRVRRDAGAPAPREAFCPAVDEIVSGVDPAGGATLVFYPDVTGYLWVFPRRDAASVGLVAREGELPGARMRERVREFLRRELPGARTLRSVGWVIPLPDPAGRLPGPIAGPRHALVGDAAGIADPITGEGIYYAMRSGALAAEAIAAGDLALYPRLVDEQLLRELAFASGWSRRFMRPRTIEAVLFAARFSRAARETIADLMSGRQRYSTLDARLRRRLGALAWILRRI